MAFTPIAHAMQALGGDSTVVVDFDSVWRYNDQNQDLGTEWVQPDYNDRSWSQGPGLLGYDTLNRRGRWPDPGLQTELEENLVTYYFRTTFNHQGSLENQALQIEQIIDDAAVYYLNGEEIARSALMPDGEVTHETRARRPTGSLERARYPLDQGSTARAGDQCLGRFGA